MAVVTQWGYYLDRCPMSGYTCPSQCQVNHNHHSKDKDCSFMEYLVTSDSTIVAYKYQDEEIEVEWVSSW